MRAKLERAMNSIKTDPFSAHLRQQAIDVAQRKILVTNFVGTDQESDLTQPPNCNGFGRIRHFRRGTSSGWPPNPLPIDPASRALGLPHTDIVRAQAFQNSACNWRCWYCFVPFALLSANEKYSEWLSPEELINLYLNEPDRPSIIDLTGGQPDLTPEWVPWTMEALEARGISDSVYLWSDDNLSNDYFWRYLSERDIQRIAEYGMYGRVCCFKGFDAASFAFNTHAEEALFDRQFELMGRLLGLGIDLYAYTTFTAASAHGIPEAMKRFVDRLQELDPNLPLRTIPLEIRVFTPVQQRMTAERTAALSHQQIAIEAWNIELEQRFSSTERLLNISEIRLRS